MKREEINDWLQVAGLIGVIASLLFVGYELEQSRDIAMAELYQARAENSTQIFQTGMSDKSAHEAQDKYFRGERVTHWEEVQVHYFLQMFITSWEMNHFLYQKGLLDQEQWDASLQSIKELFGEEMMQEYWEGARDEVRASFAGVVDDVIKKSNSEKSDQNTRY